MLHLVSRDPRGNLARFLRLCRIIRRNPFARVGPLGLEIAVSSACNYRCVFCVTHSILRERTSAPTTMPDEVLRRLVDDAAELGVREIRFAGDSEPLLFPQVTDTIRDRPEIRFKIVSNGSRLDRLTPDLFASLHKLSVSLNTIDPELHPVIHGYRGESQLPGILKNLERLLLLPDARKKIQINYVMLADNYPERLELLSWVRRKNIFAAIHPVGLSLPALEESCLTPEQLQTFLTELDAFEREHDLGRNARNSVRYARSSFGNDPNRRGGADSPPPALASCYAGFYGGFIRSDGNYSICCFAPSPLGNIVETRLRDLWLQPSFQGQVFRAATMERSGRPLYPQCVKCNEVHSYSRLFHAVFRRLPFHERAVSRKLRLLS